MSGGSWEYAYQRVEEVANRLMHEESPHRAALGRKLKDMAAALHDIEWVDSCDYGKGDELPAIMRCVSNVDVIDAARSRLRVEIERASLVLGEPRP